MRLRQSAEFAELYCETYPEFLRRLCDWFPKDSNILAGERIVEENGNMIECGLLRGQRPKIAIDACVSYLLLILNANEELAYPQFLQIRLHRIVVGWRYINERGLSDIFEVIQKAFTNEILLQIDYHIISVQ